MTEPRQAVRWDTPQVLMAVAAVSLMAVGAVLFLLGEPQSAFSVMLGAFVLGLAQNRRRRARHQPR
ncbi:hypothetical protein [Streptomonospora litoralis]|uniref:Uncharacterized protein n=1 Tax=Streptomonospora litoralis TaxID=2498135 RepID=A0A4P6PWC4_9ACTN|nr:hypothetical protein [Streptomonospora litoralis]QBI52395.1 hypothetical protein EKD16_02900 [Streptomonospora litoralis]